MAAFAYSNVVTNEKISIKIPKVTYFSVPNLFFVLLGNESLIQLYQVSVYAKIDKRFVY